MMKPSEFQTTIENQFDYICKVAMEDERKDYLKALSRQCKRETLFCDMDDYTVNLFSSEDTYPSYFHTFEMDGFTVRIENSLLAEALENLDGKKRDVILRYYFLGFDDTEISKILEVNRSTIQRRRHAGLEYRFERLKDDKQDFFVDALAAFTSSAYNHQLSTGNP